MDFDTDVIIIGAGLSGMGFAIQLMRKYGTQNFELIEKSTEIGGTWWLNTYPGCGCDVASHFFSFSWALNPDWSQKFAMQPEIRTYLNDVADKYDIKKHVRMQSVVDSAHWDPISATWSVNIRDLKTNQVTERRCKILVSAVGALSIPKKCDIPGASSFKGNMFHTAEWDHSYNWAGKKLVVIGNGCSATQAVPVMATGPGAAGQITQFSRQAHWLTERPNPVYSGFLKWTFRWVPLVMRLYRAKLYYDMEKDFVGFDTETGTEIRSCWSKEAGDYIRRAAPEKYRDFLVPKTEVGCKRRVNDTGYLDCLHQDNVELVYEDRIKEIVENGVLTEAGRLVEADAIILAHGFETQTPLAPMEIYGEKGVSINEHWNQVSEGAPSSYLGTCLSGFPNFYVMMGPNTLSGHLSVIYTTECQINFAIRLIKPVMRAISASRSMFPSFRSTTDVGVITAAAEKRDIDTTQEKARKLVWASGCTSWFIHYGSNRNTIMYPDWQFKFWLRSVFIAWGDHSYTKSRALSETRKSSIGGRVLLGTAATAAAALGAFYLRDFKF